jgi:hypothetical protein
VAARSKHHDFAATALRHAALTVNFERAYKQP